MSIIDVSCLILNHATLEVVRPSCFRALPVVCPHTVCELGVACQDFSRVLFCMH